MNISITVEDGDGDTVEVSHGDEYTVVTITHRDGETLEAHLNSKGAGELVAALLVVDANRVANGAGAST